MSDGYSAGKALEKEVLTQQTVNEYMKKHQVDPDEMSKFYSKKIKKVIIEKAGDKKRPFISQKQFEETVKREVSAIYRRNQEKECFVQIATEATPDKGTYLGKVFGLTNRGNLYMCSIPRLKPKAKTKLPDFNSIQEIHLPDINWSRIPNPPEFDEIPDLEEEEISEDSPRGRKTFKLRRP